MTELKLLILIGIANGAPILLRNLLQARLATPLDFNARCPDGRPLFGPAKTWRGVIGAIVITALIAPLFGYSFLIGGVIGGSAMLGDLVASFIKRRLGLPSSSRAIGLDQIPESLLPMLACQVLLDLGWMSTVIVVAVFFIAELLLSPILYRLHIRKRQY